MRDLLGIIDLSEPTEGLGTHFTYLGAVPLGDVTG